MNFELLDDAMLNEALAEDLSNDFRGGTLVLDEIAHPPGGIAIKRELSFDNLLPCVSDHSDDDITNDERDELQDFLKDVGILETPVPEPAPTPIPSPESFECWGVTISPVAEEQQVEPVGTTPFTFYPALQQGRKPRDSITPPPQKRRRMQVPSSKPPAKPVTPIPSKPPVTLMSMPIRSMPPNRPPAAAPSTKRKGKDPNKNRTTRQFVPFEEMQRLMTEYGPIVTPRKRKIKDDSNDAGNGGTAKMESIKRKFYRWFPDFEERFVKNPDGFTYRPKAGHENEKAYRLAMRNMDQEILNHKRKVGRGKEV